MQDPERLWSHRHPVRIVAGAGALASLADFVRERPVLLVTSAGFSRRGTVDRVRTLLGSGQVLVHDQVQPNPGTKDVEAAAEAHREAGVRGVVALGGGSALDAGKALAALLSDRTASLPSLLAGADLASARLPLVAVPTTAGTGSEVTPFATLWDHDQRRKYSLAGDQVYPTLAILDPTLTLTLDRDATLFPALDTLSHSLESLWNRHRTPFSEAFSLAALEKAATALPAVLARPDELEGRAAMQAASALAGCAISQTRTALAHSISYPLTAHHGVPHGLACSFTLPALIDHARRTMRLEPRVESAMTEAQRTLTDLDLQAQLRRFVAREQVLALVDGMYTPGRADNAAFPADTRLIRTIVEASL